MSLHVYTPMSLIPKEIEGKIRLIRNQRVMLDADLAKIYGVTTKRLNEQVKRNLERFPSDFMFQLSEIEWEILRSQIATSSEEWGGRRYLPYAFTEHGTVMLASVLDSPIAVNASIQIARAFIQLRQLLSSHIELARKIDLLERNYDAQFRSVFDAIRKLMIPPELPRRQIGFHSDD